MRLVVGITGATGVILGIRLLQVLSEQKKVETHLVISEAGEKNIKYETDWELKDVRALASFSYDIDDIGARIASGSFKRDAMIVIPCSIKTLSGLCYSYASNLLLRAGDVTLKERKPLILVARETPLHRGHLQAMLQLTEMGAIIMPPVPTFYHKPKTIDDIINHTVSRVLDLVDLDPKIEKRWTGLPPSRKKKA